MRIIALMNQKGGVGKTTTTVNLGAALAEAGQRVCLIDLDPQAHLTINYGVDPSPEMVNLYDVMVEGRGFLEAVRKIEDNIALVPGSIDLAAAEIELVSVIGRETILKEKLETAQHDFDYILLDCPPSLGLLTINALALASEVIIPMQAHFLALQGVAKLLETVQLVSKRINPKLKVSGIALTMFDAQTKLTSEVVNELQSFIESAEGQPLPWAGARIFQSKIRRNIKLAESPSFGQTIIKYGPTSNGAADYRALAREVMEMTEATPVPAPTKAPAVVAPVAPSAPPVKPPTVSAVRAPAPTPAPVVAKTQAPSVPAPRPASTPAASPTAKAPAVSAPVRAPAAPATPAPKKVEATVNPTLDPAKLAAAKVAPPAPPAPSNGPRSPPPHRHREEETRRHRDRRADRAVTRPAGAGISQQRNDPDSHPAPHRLDAHRRICGVPLRHDASAAGRRPALPASDKTLHFLSYGVISGCLYLALWVGGMSIKRAGLMVLFIVASFGVFDEILQAPVGRDPELLDWIADVSAAIVAVTCFTILRVVLSRTSAKPAIEPAPTE
jgi:chromosome partitioning protein